MDRALLMTFTELSKTLGGQLVSFGGERGWTAGFSSVSIDSRLVKPGALFVALGGSVQDGHRYVEAAFKAGAAGAMIARSRMEDGAFALGETARKARCPLIVVEDTLRGLQEAARVYLDRFPRLIRVGITGSSGKTTTTEIAAAMIGRERTTVVNPGNFNSETGLPLSIFEVSSRHEVGIFEMGMNRRGEIAELAGILKPHIALITNIGSAHIGIFGSKEEIAKEKKNIFAEFTGTETALIPEEDDFREFLAGGVRGRVLFYGPRSFTGLGELQYSGLDGTDITWEGIPVHFRLPGRHNLANALAAAAVARVIPVGPEAIRGGLATVKPLFGRSEIIRGKLRRKKEGKLRDGEITVLRDCYNSNSESAAAAITFCDALDWPGRRVYVIGSMLELGARTREAHEELGRLLAASRADRVFLYGAETEVTALAMEKALTTGEDREGNPAEGQRIRPFHTDTMDRLVRALEDYVLPGDMVLLKGSRGCALERLSVALIESEPSPLGTALGGPSG
ncbi:MAG: UDP-N-acetylmuramoyl-tripeptide--D-alanyl-D-alanine ligase [Spirochaetaceae bacterium]|jgi:UDP-N-acetylmuramoyl-tripeptide--D-alanyl-D-alanine ligase|nr:UDP-N-acetylmuramoyl-tripeptide--D-alanyl-D-alanine ligase [Spirochaetaceae bacterium]